MLIATGGINASNASLFFEAGADAIGVGSALIPAEIRQDLIQECAETVRKLFAASPSGALKPPPEERLKTR